MLSCLSGFELYSRWVPLFSISIYFVLSAVLFVIRFSFFLCNKQSFKPTPCIQRIHVVVPLLFGLRPLAALNHSRRSVTYASHCRQYSSRRAK